MFKAYYQS